MIVLTRELGGVARDLLRDPPSISDDVVDPVRDRVPELPVIGVIPAHLDRAALGRKLAADRPEIGDRLSFLHADHRFAEPDRFADRPGDVLGLRAAIRVLGALASLLFACTLYPFAFNSSNTVRSTT